MMRDVLVPFTISFRICLSDVMTAVIDGWARQLFDLAKVSKSR